MSNYIQIHKNAHKVLHMCIISLVNDGLPSEEMITVRITSPTTKSGLFYAFLLLDGSTVHELNRWLLACVICHYG